MYVRMYVCMYVRTYVHTYVCMYVCTYVICALNNLCNDNLLPQPTNRSLMLINNTNTYFSTYQTKSLAMASTQECGADFLHSPLLVY